MKALLVLFAAQLAKEAFLPLCEGKNSLTLTLERLKKIPSVGKTVLFAGGDFPEAAYLGEAEVEKSAWWTKKSLFQTVEKKARGFDLVYFSWADCPFADPQMAEALAKRHADYGAHYSYAEGWPYGICPEIMSAHTAGILAKILADDDGGPVTRDALFSVIQKDINAFDIEAEISPADLRSHRLNFCADSKRNFLLLSRFANETDVPSSGEILSLIKGKPEMLRTLPAFYPIQVFAGCPQNCSYCPYPLACGAGGSAGRREYMEASKFEQLLDKIAGFSGDAVIDLSLWGELSLHPQKMELVAQALSRPSLSLVIETSGLGWTPAELEQCAKLAESQPPRKSRLSPLSWIVSLDSADSAKYKEIRGGGFAEAAACAEKLFSLLPKDTYVQAVRTKGGEDDIEKFWRHWKEKAPLGEANIIIQKYDDFCGFLEKKQAADISPVTRQPCWHIMRDMPVLIDGTALFCRQDLGALSSQAAAGAAGNVFSQDLETIWENGRGRYLEQCEKKYAGLCAECDEYYTYNF